MRHMSIQIKPAVINDGAHFGQVLKMARVSSGQTADQLGALLGVSRGTVSAREAGRRQIDVDSAVITLAACGYALCVVPATDVL
jgi:transcriptional regulator with XRE-family HTH domain